MGKDAHFREQCCINQRADAKSEALPPPFLTKMAAGLAVSHHQREPSKPEQGLVSCCSKKIEQITCFC